MNDLHFASARIHSATREIPHPASRRRYAGFGMTPAFVKPSGAASARQVLVIPRSGATRNLPLCKRRIAECGGIDLQLLGIGAAGHIGFNEPLSALRSRTREKALSPATIAQNAPLFDSPDQMPKRGITMGVGAILESRRCLLLATGAEKAAILAQAVEGPITAMVSASALQLHPSCRVIVDEAAAAHLRGTDYYRWIFQNEPEWAEFR